MGEINTLINSLASNPEAILETGAELSIPVLAVNAVVSLLICVLGLKLIRLWNVLAGLAAGAAAGAAVSLALGLDVNVFLIVTGIAAVIIAVLSGIFKRFGAFLFSFTAISGIAVSLLGFHNLIFVGIAVVVALIIAVLTVIWFEPMVIVVTSIYGGFGLGGAVAGLGGLKNPYVCVAIYVVLIILGMVIQFTMKSGEIKRRDRKRAQAIKEEHSVESEIDKARAILDADDEDDDY